jgi:hypothetical protein
LLKKEEGVKGFLQSFPEITHIFHEFVIALNTEELPDNALV